MNVFGHIHYLLVKGNADFIVDFSGLISHIEDGRMVTKKYHHVVIPLLGCFKNESGEIYHSMISSNRTKYGVEVRRWV